MSAKKSSGSTSANTTQNAAGSSVTNATNPDWVTNGVQGLLGQITGLTQNDAAPGASALQMQAFNQGSNLTSGANRYQGATDAANSAEGIRPESLLDGLDNYMSPYTQRVVDTTLNDFDVNADRTRAAQAAQGAQSQAFGGSRWGVQEGQTEGELARARATADATLRDSAFNTGAGLSGQDADRRQQASMFNSSQDLAKAGLLGTFASGGQSADAQNLGLLSGLGDTQRGIEAQQSPLALLMSQAGLLGDLPLDLFKGQSTNTTGSSTGSSSGKSSGTSVGGDLDDLAKLMAMF